MPKHHNYVFVLWGDEFEEVAATVFVTELRQAGLRVKVVGLGGQRIRGTHGLVLMPDLTLDQALHLATNTICLIIPQASPGLKRLKNDPRLHEFFCQAHVNQAKFVFGAANEVDIAELGLFPPTSMDQIIVYPASEDLVDFARELADSLSRI